MKAERKELIDIVAREVPRVWDAIAGDIGGGTIPVAEVIELSIDANRLATFGNPDAEAAKDLLIEDGGYPLFLKQMIKAMPFSHYEA